MKVFYINIDDELTGINAISLVESPAVEKDFLCCSKEKKTVKLNFDNAKRVISGVVCLADTPIYRYNEKYGEYYVVFSKETIQKMVEKFAKMDLFKSVNLQHDDTKFVDGIYMFESYIINKERGINPVEFSDIPDGSWIASFKVENEELWNEIKSGNELNGFSLAGLFAFAEPENEEVDELEQYIDEILK